MVLSASICTFFGFHANNFSSYPKYPVQLSVVSGLVRPSTGGVSGTSNSGSRGGGSASGGGRGSSIDLRELRQRLNMLKGQI